MIVNRNQSEVISKYYFLQYKVTRIWYGTYFEIIIAGKMLYRKLWLPKNNTTTDCLLTWLHWLPTWNLPWYDIDDVQYKFSHILVALKELSWPPSFILRQRWINLCYVCSNTLIARIHILKFYCTKQSYNAKLFFPIHSFLF